MLSALYDQTLKIWDAASGACLLTLSGHSHSVWGARGRRRAAACSRLRLMALFAFTMRRPEWNAGRSAGIYEHHAVRHPGRAWTRRPTVFSTTEKTREDTSVMWFAMRMACRCGFRRKQWRPRTRGGAAWVFTAVGERLRWTCSASRRCAALPKYCEWEDGPR